MKILITCSGNHPNISPFVKEQADSLTSLGIDVYFFLIKNKGFLGYLKNISYYKRCLKTLRPHIIHAHFGLTGLFSSLQVHVPVVITFHGSDVTNRKNRLFSFLALCLSREAIFVEKRISKLLLQRNANIIPCGIEINTFKNEDKILSREKLGLDISKKYILFSSRFDNYIKNYPLAIQSLKMITEYKLEILELNGYSRNEVNFLLNAVDCCLLTSFSEGSPQFIKEAMACNCPIVSTDVGDVKEVFGQTEGCYICSFDPVDVANKIRNALAFNKRTNGRNRIIELGLDSESTANRVIDIYKKMLNEKH